MHIKVWAQFVQFPFDVRLTTDRVQFISELRVSNTFFNKFLTRIYKYILCVLFRVRLCK